MGFCHLYADGEVKFENGMELICRTDYPYDMTVNYWKARRELLKR